MICSSSVRASPCGACPMSSRALTGRLTSSTGAAAPARRPGTLYAAGWAYGSAGVGQPCRSAVLYWNQSPAARGRDDRDVLDSMYCRDLLDQRHLRRRVVPCRVLVEQRVDRRVGVALVVAVGLLADGGAVLRVEHLAQLVVRGRDRTSGLTAVGEVVVAVVELVVVRLLLEVLDRQLDADRGLSSCLMTCQRGASQSV